MYSQDGDNLSNLSLSNMEEWIAAECSYQEPNTYIIRLECAAVTIKLVDDYSIQSVANMA